MFIAFEGIDGSGKSTQAHLLTAHLQEMGRQVFHTRFPNNDEHGPQIATKLYGDMKFNARTWALLHAADRAYHAETIIAPSLEAGYDVVCDRYTESSFAYQVGGQLLDEATVHLITEFSANGVVPDITFLIDVPLNIAEQRVRTRGSDTWFNVPFLERVRIKYLKRAAMYSKIHVIDGTGTPEQVHNDVKEILSWH